MKINGPCKIIFGTQVWNVKKVEVSLPKLKSGGPLAFRDEHPIDEFDRRTAAGERLDLRTGKWSA